MRFNLESKNFSTEEKQKSEFLKDQAEKCAKGGVGKNLIKPDSIKNEQEKNEESSVIMKVRKAMGL